MQNIISWTEVFERFVCTIINSVITVNDEQAWPDWFSLWVLHTEGAGNTKFVVCTVYRNNLILVIISYSLTILIGRVHKYINAKLNVKDDFKWNSLCIKLYHDQ